MLLLCGALLTAAACTVSVDATGARFRCANDHDCPANFLCGAEGVCASEDPEPPADDAGTADGPCAPITFPEVVLEDTPLVYYPMSETTGTTVFDASGNGHNGNLANTLTFGVEGARLGGDNRAIRFGNDNAYAYPGDLVWPPAMTWELVFRPLDPVPPSYGALMGVGEYLQDGWRLVMTAEDQLLLYCNESGCTEPEAAGPRVARGDWHHLVLTVAGNDFRVWLDGQPIISVTFPSYVPHLVGGAWLGPGEGLRMIEELDDAVIYDHVLTDEAIARHARAALAESICRP